MFKIKTDNQTVSLSREQLLMILVEKVSTRENEDHIAIGETLANYLEASGLFKTITPMQLITLAFGVGYYYKLFLSKNKVEVGNADTINETSTQ